MARDLSTHELHPVKVAELQLLVSHLAIDRVAFELSTAP
jgi:hypothetical protein